MPIPHAEKLIEQAQGGVRLSAKDRKYCLAFLSATKADMNNNELAALFQVSERQIRFDYKAIREEKAREITQEDISLIIADIAMTLERQMRDLEKSKNKCKAGSVAYLRHCTAIHDMQLKTVSALQDLGYYPKNLGNMTIDKYEYKSIITKDGAVDTRPMILDIDSKDVEFIEAVGQPLALPEPTQDFLPLEEPAELQLVEQQQDNP